MKAVGLSLLLLLAACAHASPRSIFTPVQGSQRLTGTLIVKPKDFASGQANLSKNKVDEIPGLGLLVVKVPAGKTHEEYAQQLMATGSYEFAVPNFKNKLARIPNDRRFKDQWHLDRMQCKRAWEYITGTKDNEPEMIIAVVDSGVSKDHVDLKNQLVPGYNAITRKSEYQGGITTDVSGHGTEVAGCIAATGNNAEGISGVGWNFKIMPVRVTNDTNPTNGFAEDKDILAGIYWAAASGAKVVNVSWSGVQNPAYETAGSVLRSVFDSLLVFAAGNNNANLSTFDHANVIIVGGTGKDDKLAPLSNYGKAVDCVAPGADILTTLKSGGYGFRTGTSFAAPLVTGALALIWSMDRTQNAATVERNLYMGNYDLGPYGNDDTFGHGRVNLFRNILMTRKYRVIPIDPPLNTKGLQGWVMNNTTQVSCNVLSGDSTNINKLDRDAFIYANGFLRDLGSVPGYAHEAALFIDRLGRVVGWAYNGAYDNPPTTVPYIWDGFSLVQLATPPGAKHSHALAVGANGEIVGRAGQSYPWLSQNGNAYYWASKDAAPQAFIKPLEYTSANCVNIGGDGMFYGYLIKNDLTRVTCRWSSPGANPEILALPAPYSNYFFVNGVIPNWLQGNAVGASGKFVPVIVDGANIYNPPIWDPVNGCLMSDPNIDKAFVGTSYLNAPEVDGTGLIWDNGFLRKMDDLLDSQSQDWKIVWGRNINSAGEISGVGLQNGVFKGFVATPFPAGGQGGLTVNCSVILEDFVSETKTVEAEFVFTDALTGQELLRTSITPDEPNDPYKVQAPGTGVVNVTAKAGHWLAKKVNDIEITSSGGFRADFVLINGDIDGDNYIGTDDLLVLTAAWDKQLGDAGYDARADLNGDDYIGTDDYEIFNKNFDTLGD